MRYILPLYKQTGTKQNGYQVDRRRLALTTQKGGIYKMEAQKEKIMRFSRIIYILLKVVMIVLIVAAALIAASWIVTGAGLPTETVTIGGADMQAPVLFKLGDTRVILPVAWQSGAEYFGIKGLLPAGSIEDFLGIIFTIVGLRFAMRVFRLLKENGSPFRDDVIKSMKRLAIVLLVVGFVSGLISFIAAGIIWIFCLIFDYGRMLQNESDTTL